MSLFRPAPGGLSINTSSANLFGSSTANNSSSNDKIAAPGTTGAGGGLFGTASTTTTAPSQPAQSGCLFGNSTAIVPTSQPAPSGGLFGSTATTNATTQPSVAGGLFGGATATTASAVTSTTAPAAANQPAQATNGLFGSKPANQVQGAMTGGLFGGLGAANSTNPNPSQNLTSNAATGGLFGGSNLASTQTHQQQHPQQHPQQATTTASGGGLFGATSNQTTTPQPAQAGPTSSLFGASLLSRPHTTTTTAIAPAAVPTAATASTSQIPAVGPLGPGVSLGHSLNQQQSVPGVRIDISNIRGTTRFNDLQEDLQKQISDADRVIQSFIAQSHELDAFMPGHGDMLSNIPNDVKFVQRKHQAARQALNQDWEAIEVVRNLVKDDADAARLSFRATDNLKLPSQYHVSGLWAPKAASGTANAETDGQDLVGFFSKSADDMATQLGRYQTNLSEIETHMHGVQTGLVEQMHRTMTAKAAGAGGSSADEKLAELGAVLRDFERSIIQVAGEVGRLKQDISDVQIGDFMQGGTERDGMY